MIIGDSMKKTKIICSIGPASQNIDVMSQMIKSGMNVARINFSHGTYDEYSQIVNVVKEARRLTNQNISILFDTKGPDFRCGTVQEGGINLINGNLIRIVKENVLGTEQSFSVNHPESIDKINVGNTILLEDALMKLLVVSKEYDGITCKVIEGGILNSHKGMNVPGIKLGLPFMSEQDRNDIIFACTDGDAIALSFVESRENVLEVKKVLQEHNRTDMLIISKIESCAGVENLDEIIDESDGIMVARGDLGVEVPVEKLPIIQKQMIKKCREKGKFVIVATEMLASMYTSPRPTRAEVTDISNAVFDGTDCVMLSGETTVGKHPIDAVGYMAKICEETENSEIYENKKGLERNNDITEAIANAVLTSSNKLNVKTIVVPTNGGHSAMVMSNYRPRVSILALCPNEKVARRLSMCYGIYPKVVENMNENDMDDLVMHAKTAAKNLLNLNEKDIIIVTGGVHENQNIKQTNFMKIEEI